MAAYDTGTSLEQTPTWTVASACALFIIISLIIERILHTLAKKWKHEPYKMKVLEKMKDELMLLGFISLLLTVFQAPMAKFCVPKSWTTVMLPCELVPVDESDTEDKENGNRRRLLEFLQLDRRSLAGTTSDPYCENKNQVPYLSYTGLHQLHIFIFVLAVSHICICFLTMALGKTKIRRWRKWEEEIARTEQQEVNRDDDLRLTKEDEFLRRYTHRPWSEKTILRWTVCFFQQFLSSVTRHDYVYLRRGFINTHLHGRDSYDFHTYILRSLGDDFKKVVGISLPLWIFIVLYLLLNIYGWHTHFWMTFLPLIMLLIVGTKLQIVITEMAREIGNKHAIVQGNVTVKPRDELFWFGRPKLLLSIMHYVLFQNAFEFAFFAWVWSTFSFKSCLFENTNFMIVRLCIGVFVQILFSYVILPQYALITQMGSHYKAAILPLPVVAALEGLHERAKQHIRKQEKSSHGTHHDLESTKPYNSPTISTLPSPMPSPEHIGAANFEKEMEMPFRMSFPRYRSPM